MKPALQVMDVDITEISKEVCACVFLLVEETFTFYVRV